MTEYEQRIQDSDDVEAKKWQYFQDFFSSHFEPCEPSGRPPTQVILLPTSSIPLVDSFFTENSALHLNRSNKTRKNGYIVVIFDDFKSFGSLHGPPRGPSTLGSVPPTPDDRITCSYSRGSWELVHLRYLVTELIIRTPLLKYWF